MKYWFENLPVYSCSYHSRKKRKNSLETRAIYIEISMVSWNLPNGPKHRGSIFRNMASSEGNQQHAKAFHATMDKTVTDILQIAKKWNWKWIITHQAYFFRKIPAIYVSYVPSWSLKFWQNVKMFQLKQRNVMQEQSKQPQVNKI